MDETKDDKAKRLFTVPLTEREHEELARLAEASMRSRSALIRSWLQSASRLEKLEVSNGERRV